MIAVVDRADKEVVVEFGVPLVVVSALCGEFRGVIGDERHLCRRVRVRGGLWKVDKSRSGHCKQSLVVLLERRRCVHVWQLDGRAVAVVVQGRCGLRISKGFWVLGYYVVCCSFVVIQSRCTRWAR